MYSRTKLPPIERRYCCELISLFVDDVDVTMVSVCGHIQQNLIRLTGEDLLVVGSDHGEVDNSVLSKLASASTNDSTLLGASADDNHEKALLQLVVKSILVLSEQMKELQRSNKNIEKKLELQDVRCSLEKEFDDNDDQHIPTNAVIEDEETNFMLGASGVDEIPLKPSNDVFITLDSGKNKEEGQKFWKELVYSYKGDKVKEVNMAPMKAKKARFSESHMTTSMNTIGKKLFISPNTSNKTTKNNNNEGVDEENLAEGLNRAIPLFSASSGIPCLIPAIYVPFLDISFYWWMIVIAIKDGWIYVLDSDPYQNHTVQRDFRIADVIGEMDPSEKGESSEEDPEMEEEYSEEAGNPEDRVPATPSLPMDIDAEEDFQCYVEELGRAPEPSPLRSSQASVPDETVEAADRQSASRDGPSYDASGVWPPRSLSPSS
ncbi:hypothetical protein PIB30_058254 [Stylosanthes scabra]|uniref:Ubiquitin-like protease family profile domain-containing protein n=1 Tax=Stylosanthes scabra TaxID=79078 RepID=A0ABU6YIT6_9FABA|nr:hypothetical protein [Stylosanthes scabra]